MAPLIRMLLVSAFVTKDHNNHRAIDVRGNSNNARVRLLHTTAASRVSLLPQPSFVGGTRGKKRGYRKQYEVFRMSEDDETNDELKMVEEIESTPNDDNDETNISTDDEVSNVIQEDVPLISDNDENTDSDSDDSILDGGSDEEKDLVEEEDKTIIQSSISNDVEVSRIVGENEIPDENDTDSDDDDELESSSEDYNFSQLCELFGATQPKGDMLSLRTDSDGIRGVYVSDAVGANEVLLRMPLKSCLRDDEPPAWLGDNNNDEDDNSDSYVSVEGWVTRLTASLLDVHQRTQDDEKTSKALRMWLGSLPNNLREILPIHWDESLLEASGSRALQCAIDSAYFARSGPLGDILAALKASGAMDESTPQSSVEEALEDALDLVQTRSCRAVASDGSQPGVRVLAPIFDMINHARENNAEFFREGEDLVVRTTRELLEDDQVFISYGASTVPAWKCLFSYGFVPMTDDVYEDDVAEILLDDGTLVEVGPTEIPFELVRFASWSGQYDKTEGDDNDDPSSDNGGMELNPEIGQRIVEIITNAAKQLEEPLAVDDDSQDDAAIRSINDLRRSNRRTLLACAGGLREFLEYSM